MSILYFAYGSNMLSKRLAQRVDSTCKLIGQASVSSYQLKFNKRSVDGSGKANIVHTQQDEDLTYGVIWELPETSKALLDKFELGYETINLSAKLTDSSQAEVFTYSALPDFLDDYLLPYNWYKNILIAGAEEHSLPEAYIDKVRQIASVKDKNQDRAEKQSLLLG